MSDLPCYDGRKNPARRAEIERAGAAFIDTIDGGNRIVDGFQEYRKTSTIYAVRVDEPYEVETLEGKHDGKAGSYLAVGVAGELYPIDAAVFEESYEEAER